MRKKKALICGISGQDGSYLAKFLLEKKYRVFGTSSNVKKASFNGLKRLKIIEHVNLKSVAINNSKSVFQIINEIRPDEIYNLAGPSSVTLSFQQPVETMDSIIQGTLNILEALRCIGEPIRFYNAGSGECFGDTKGTAANENTMFCPKSPYAVAKATSFWQVANYRDAYHVFCCSGILFNHESPLRPDHFVTKKIISTACRIASGSIEKLRLGNLLVSRDWGWAPEYVRAMWLMLQQKTPDDFVIATGKTFKLQDFVCQVFLQLGMNWRDHVEFDERLKRPLDILVERGNPQKAKKLLKWKAVTTIEDIIRLMINAEKTFHK